MTDDSLDHVAKDAVLQLRKASWESPIEEQLAAIAAAEKGAERLLTAERWLELAPLAGMISEAYCHSNMRASKSEKLQIGARRRRWCEVEVDAAGRAEGDSPGPMMLAALMRLGRSQIVLDGDNSQSHATFVEAVAVAERMHGVDSPHLVVFLQHATTGAAPDRRLELAQRALRLSEAAYGASSEKLDGPLSNFAWALAAVGRIDEAIHAAERAIAVSAAARGVTPILGELSTLYSMAGRFEEAIAMQRDCLAASVSQSEPMIYRLIAHGRLAETLNDAGRHGEALQTVDEALAAYEEHPWLCSIRAVALHALGRSDEAREEAHRSIALARAKDDACAERMTAHLAHVLSPSTPSPTK